MWLRQPFGYPQLHVYIHQDYNLASHTTYVVLILYMCGRRSYSLKPTPNYRFGEKLFYCNFIYSQSFCQNSEERKSLEISVLALTLASCLKSLQEYGNLQPQSLAASFKIKSYIFFLGILSPNKNYCYERNLCVCDFSQLTFTAECY